MLGDAGAAVSYCDLIPKCKEIIQKKGSGNNEPQEVESVLEESKIEAAVQISPRDAVVVDGNTYYVSIMHT